ncbi:hypothetical protein CFC21_106228 [Triticum aestivum]|uniref:NB-ARC domain-containing protein n=2 Tax=Triticum aestivum TaxID=4565 RepID=A0A9R1MDR4_WHEAT|nr:hypothetical protein CFC21_106227 [Triticum aestivum]KAF7105413.1 hypothetical protein CFC21_106228 [Triticum aestivum]
MSGLKKTPMRWSGRNSGLPFPLCCNETIHLQDMEDTDILALFKDHAFSGAAIRDQRLREQLETLAEKLAKRLGRSPLAAKTVGSQLSRKKDKAAWEDALRIDNLSDPSRALLWSYEKLDPSFAEELVHMWVLVGLIDSCNANKTMEDLMRDCVNEMVNVWFLQRVNRSEYVMHDLVHDLAESLSEKFGATSTIYLQTTSFTHLYLHSTTYRDDARDIFQQVLQNLKKLCVLHLRFYNSSKLPESVGELKHLSDDIKILPEKLFNLTKLRYLQGCDEIPHICKLISLQHNRQFCVQKQLGYEVRQLKDMNNLGGGLCLTNLENVTGKDQALEAKLHQKSQLERLHLEWSDNDDMASHYSSHLETLEGLMPPPQIKGLTIKGYRHAKYAGWLLEDSCFQNLESLDLVNCSALQILPSNATLFGNCSSLLLEHVPNLKTLPSLPTSLEKLQIEKCMMLMFISKDELKQHNLRENTMVTYDLKARLSSMLEEYSVSEIKEVLLSEHSSLKPLMILMDADISRLQTIKSALERVGDEVLVIEDIIKAWVCCHEDRLGLVFRRNINLPLVPPSGLSQLHLSLCIVIDGALAVCPLMVSLL